ncbi:MAG: hypothetical protein KDD82_07200 [Planctomycetes bacterium]|nr:hypothetical protein [Planctomycetota bacterium]
MNGQGFVQPGNALLGIDFPERGWHMELARLDGEGEPRFGGFHKNEVRPVDLAGLVPTLGGLAFRQARGLPGMPESCETTTEVFRVVLTAKRSAEPPVTWERMVAELRSWLGETPGGRRLA